MTHHISAGIPCWYELSTTDLDVAGTFYADVLGWKVTDSGMPGMTYHLAAAADGGLVAGLGPVQSEGVPPNWLIYFSCVNCDETASGITADGGRVVVEPMDVPGTGRFAICADPQGAMFGILQPEPMDAPMDSPAFNQQATGHGAWHELMSSDPAAGFAFYAKHFGWTKGQTMQMGEMGDYQLFQNDGNDLGGMMGLANSPMPVWLPYFVVDSVESATGRVSSAGGSLHHGPADVPGGAFIAIATDPQGAWFAVTGPR